jgi:hypothetical protein
MSVMMIIIMITREWDDVGGGVVHDSVLAMTVDRCQADADAQDGAWL